MGVVVYPRLGELLPARRMTVAALRRTIEERFGLAVDPKTLYRLTRSAAIRRADLEVAGAAAAVLEVPLDTLFEVCVTGGGTATGRAAKRERDTDDAHRRVLEGSRLQPTLLQRSPATLLLRRE